VAPADVVLAAEAVLTPDERLAPGWAHVRGDRIAAVGAGAPPDAGAPVERLPDGALLAPGFVDLHVHGGGGAQVAADSEQVAAVARFHAEHGTTSLLATTVPAPEAALHATVRAVAAVAAEPPRGRARVLGTHLEGPFVSAERPGALDVQHLRAPDRGELERLIAAGGGTVRAVVVAPELEGALDLVAAAADAGVVVALGHTDATAAETRAAVDRGGRAVTHLFNAMRPLHHREPGVAGVALTDPRLTVELIADGVHVHPTVLALVHAAKGASGIALVTDAMQAAGLPDGDYALGEQQITVADGEARTAAGALAGSTLTMDRAVRVCVEEAGVPLGDALRMASTTPAALLGRDARIAPGAPADLVVLDSGLRAIGTMVGGAWAFRDAALARAQARNDPRTSPAGPATAPDSSSPRISSSP
jgi:N-acetylglucosamine-6-phosphate deacetylase